MTIGGENTRIGVEKGKEGVSRAFFSYREGEPVAESCPKYRGCFEFPTGAARKKLKCPNGQERK